MTKVVVGMTCPLGPVMFVPGVWSAKPNVSIFLIAFVASFVPLVAYVRAWIWIRRLPEIVSDSDHAVDVAPGVGEVHVDGVRAPRTS